PRFEGKLTAGTADLPANRFAAIAYESLVANPLGVIEDLYGRLELGNFDPMREVLRAEMNRRSGYKAKASMPSAAWQERISQEWAPLLTRHSALA
ncbi:MAG TPA: hypothetical protein VKM56_08950, partial [Verrucomicrobiae bacterium]|nr:hypothetical protein [Verrucomicrobiae bacterium]